MCNFIEYPMYYNSTIFYLQNFKQGMVSSFLMTTPDSLGTPCVLKVSHDNSGEGDSASWYLLKIIIVDRAVNKWYDYDLTLVEKGVVCI